MMTSTAAMPPSARVQRRHALPTALLLVISLGPTATQAQSFDSGDWSFGLRAQAMQLSRTTVNGVEFSFDPALSVELSARRDLRPNVFAETTLGWPTSYAVTDYRPGINSTLKTTRLTLMPATLSLNWVGARLGDFDLYGGGGVGLVRLGISDSHSPPWTLKDTVSTSLTAQVGVDYTTDRGWKANLNLRWQEARADLQPAGYPTVYPLRLNPWTLGAGVAWRF